jgi:hypothetical protein
MFPFCGDTSYHARLRIKNYKFGAESKLERIGKVAAVA